MIAAVVVEDIERKVLCPMLRISLELLLRSWSPLSCENFNNLTMRITSEEICCTCTSLGRPVSKLRSIT